MIPRALTAVLALAMTIAFAAGCGSRCAEVATIRTDLAARTGAPDRGPDVRVTIPFAAANALVADVLRAAPITVPMVPPDLGRVATAVLALPPLTASLGEARFEPGPPGTIRFAARVALHAGAEELATLDLVADAAPTIRSTATPATPTASAVESTALVFAIAPDDLVAIRPTLGPRARAALGRLVAGHLPPQVALPQVAIDALAARLAEHLVTTGYRGLRDTLLVRLGALTRLQLALPDLPIADVALRSSPDALVVELTTSLPVRRGLTSSPTADAVTVQLSGSAVAELANWAITTGRAPQHYTRSLRPDPAGAFRPYFDYLADDRRHPWKVHVLQERDGCSYFRVGVRASIALRGDALEATAFDRALERRLASPAIDVLAWAKYFLFGSLDVSRRVAAHTRLTVAGRPFAARVVDAALTDGELRVGLRLAAPSDPR